METTTNGCGAIQLACCFLLLMTTISGNLLDITNAKSLIKDNPRYDLRKIFLIPHAEGQPRHFHTILLQGNNFDSSMLLTFTKSENINDNEDIGCPQNSHTVSVGQPRNLILHNDLCDAFFDVHASNMPQVGDQLLVCLTSLKSNSKTFFYKLLLDHYSIQSSPDANSLHKSTNITQRPINRKWRLRRDIESVYTEQGNREQQNNDWQHRKRFNQTSEVLGMSFEYDSDKKVVIYENDGTPHILESTHLRMKLYGRFSNRSVFRFTKFETCNDSSNREPILPIILDPTETVATVHVKLPKLGELDDLYICVGEEVGDRTTVWTRQGGSHKPWLKIHLEKKLLPVWLHLCLISVLLVLSGLFSGLNLGLMSLNKTDLKIIINTGTEQEKGYASRIAPVRKRGNFLLCCLLFSNVLVNSTLTILVDDLTTGLIAILMSTMAIVIFGEIIPQAICSRHGLAVGARTIFVTKFFMGLTAPLAYPLSLILDKILGEEIGNVYTRERLKELLKVTKDYHGLANEEVGIISGALEMKTKTVKDIMTKLENVFMLPCEATLDFDTMAEVEYHGYTRIPVYDGEKNNVVALLNVKQLTLLDATDGIPLRAVIEYYHNQLFFVFENTHLDYMFRAFREGNRGHMAFVQKVNDEGPGDPYYETMGIVTMEDVLEELLQADIKDENDVGKMQARGKNPRRKYAPMASNKRSKACVEIQKPLALASTQYLATSIPAFQRELISVAIVQRLLRTNVFLMKISKFKYNEGSLLQYLYEAEKPSDYFTMILEGRIKVEVGREKIAFEGGPFTTFGSEFLLRETEREKNINETPTDPNQRRQFVPDYTVKILTDVQYLRLNYASYKAARLATELERNYGDPEKAAANKNWEEDIEKVLRGVDYDQSGQNTDNRIIPRRPSNHIFITENGDVPNEETKLL